MAVLRDRPYHQFNFLVDLGTGDTAGIEAGFAECSAIEFEVAEYRNGTTRRTRSARSPGCRRSPTSRSSAG